MPKRVNTVANVKQIALGSHHMLCLQHDGNVVAWGENINGELGLGFKGKFNEPAQNELKDIIYLCASNGFTFAVNNKNRVIAFGCNRRNELGVIGEKEILFPEEILSLKKIVKVVSINRFALALDEIGQVYGWGQFIGTDHDYNMKPTMIEGLKYVKDIAATDHRGYILTEDDRILVIRGDYENLEVLEIDTGEKEEKEDDE